MKIYTKKGDDGTTSLTSGQRVCKEDVRVEAYGQIDEFDAALGLARALCRHTEVADAVRQVQSLLWKVMAEVSSRGDVSAPVSPGDAAALEAIMDRFDARLQPLRAFVVPGDNPSSAALHVARTVARRAERELWRLARKEPVAEPVLVLFNRLSDLCFILARVEAELAP